VREASLTGEWVIKKNAYLRKYLFLTMREAYFTIDISSTPPIDHLVVREFVSGPLGTA
jgi:hypothetical protein